MILIRNPELFANVVALLHQFPDLDKMLNGLINDPSTMTVITARQGIDTMIYIKNAICSADALASVLLEHKNVSTDEIPGILSSAITNFRDLKLEMMVKLIKELINDETTFSKSAHEMRYQECFAVRNGVDGLLDVARKTYLHTIDDIQDYTQYLTSTVGFPVRINFSASRGYHLLIPADINPLPPIFIQAVQNKRVISCVTPELRSLSDRAMETITQSISITNQLIKSRLEQMRNDIDVLFRMIDTVVSFPITSDLCGFKLNLRYITGVTGHDHFICRYSCIKFYSS